MQREYPRGLIVAWNKSINEIPTTWRLCDGTRLTPDLRDRFIIGGGDTYNPNERGGQMNHKHPFISRGHRHDLVAPGAVHSDLGYAAFTTDVPAEGTTDYTDHLPPYHSLYYIMYDGRRN